MSSTSLVKAARGTPDWPARSVRARTGAGPQPSDTRLPDGLSLASKPRALAENCLPSRGRATTDLRRHGAGRLGRLHVSDPGRGTTGAVAAGGRADGAVPRRGGRATAPYAGGDRHCARDVPRRGDLRTCVSSHRSGNPVDQVRVARLETLASALRASAPQSRPEPLTPGTRGRTEHLPFSRHTSPAPSRAPSSRSTKPPTSLTTTSCRRTGPGTPTTSSAPSDSWLTPTRWRAPAMTATSSLPSSSVGTRRSWTADPAGAPAISRREPTALATPASWSPCWSQAPCAPGTVCGATWTRPRARRVHRSRRCRVAPRRRRQRAHRTGHEVRPRLHRQYRRQRRRRRGEAPAGEPSPSTSRTAPTGFPCSPRPGNEVHERSAWTTRLTARDCVRRQVARPAIDRGRARGHPPASGAHARGDRVLEPGVRRHHDGTATPGRAAPGPSTEAGTVLRTTRGPPRPSTR